MVSPVHPHGCGEHPRPRSTRSTRRGSSPRVWGTLLPDCDDRFQQRFIPTGVGNTLRRRCPRSPCSVHPHGCGEHPMSRSRPRSMFGSSPRVWGTHDSIDGNYANTRFIPTGVGNTSLRASIASMWTVHPHGCGEHPSTWKTSTSPRGSSPRVWGTLWFMVGPKESWRFIPTGVGNTDFYDLRGVMAPVHPHGCGEHSRRMGPARRPGGSSPRVWGTPHRCVT